MNSAATVPQRKPAARVNAPAVCFCNHAEQSHKEGRCHDCCCDGVWLPRPCTCGHHHDGRCTECRCKMFRQDDSPQRLLRRGVRAGEWGFRPKAHHRFEMRPKCEMDTRVWNCLMLHIELDDRRCRLAVRTDAHGRPAKDGLGRLIPLSPSDIRDELNAQDKFAQVQKEQIRKSLRSLEEQGGVKVRGDKHHHIRIFVYMRPVLEKPQGVKSDPLAPVLSTKNGTCEDVIIVNLKSSLVKAFVRSLRSDLPEGVKSDPLEIARALSEGVTTIYLVIREGVKSGESPIQKLQEIRDLLDAPAVSSLSSSKQWRSVGQSDAVPSPGRATDRPTDRKTGTQPQTPEVEAVWSLLEARKLPFRTGQPITVELCQEISRRLNGTPIEWLDRKIEQRFKAITSLGLVSMLASEVALAYSQTVQSIDRPSQANQAELEARAAEAQREIEQYEQRERYESFLNQETDAHMQRMMPAVVEQRIKAHMERIRSDAPQYRWPDAALRGFALRKLREELAAEIDLPGFEEYSKQFQEVA